MILAALYKPTLALPVILVGRTIPNLLGAVVHEGGVKELRESGDGEQLNGGVLRDSNGE